MLKIKSDVDIRRLEAYGFKPKFDENTGEIIAYEKIKKKQEHLGVTVKIEHIKKFIRIFQFKKYEWRINPYNTYFDVDTLYDLITAGLVEKIEERN